MIRGAAMAMWLLLTVLAAAEAQPRVVQYPLGTPGKIVIDADATSIQFEGWHSRDDL